MSVVALSPPRTRTPAKMASRILAYKRPLDLTVILLALPVIAPILALAMIAVALTSPGPVFFVQTRVGQNGRLFKMIKLRSMFVDAHARRAALEAASQRSGLCFKMQNDPRITAVGRVLRRTSLDELPQIFNVLRGDMSLVGPRPALPCEVAAYPMVARGRLAALPGLTGLWQVSGRADLSFDEMIALDLKYVQTASLGTDLRLLRATIGAVTTGRGAY